MRSKPRGKVASMLMLPPTDVNVNFLGGCALFEQRVRCSKRTRVPTVLTLTRNILVYATGFVFKLHDICIEMRAHILSRSLQSRSYIALSF
jgi:hypothetical protein